MVDMNNHLSVRKGDFQRCFETLNFCQWAYKSKDHLLKDMEHPKYFAMVRSRLRDGDLIVCIDAAMQMKTYMVDYIDDEASVMQMSVLHVMEAKPVFQEGEELRWRWRGPKGGGHCVVDKNGEPVEKGFASRQAAEDHIARFKMKRDLERQSAEQPEAA